MKKYTKILLACILSICVFAGSVSFLGAFANQTNNKVIAEGTDNLFVNGSFEASDSTEFIIFADSNTKITDGWVVSTFENAKASISDKANTGDNALSIAYKTGGKFKLHPDTVDDDGIINGLDKGVYKISFYAKGEGKLELGYKDATNRKRIAKAGARPA